MNVDAPLLEIGILFKNKNTYTVSKKELPFSPPLLSLITRNEKKQKNMPLQTIARVEISRKLKVAAVRHFAYTYTATRRRTLTRPSCAR